MYFRVVGVLMRSGQALLPRGHVEVSDDDLPVEAAGHLYVDDAIFSILGKMEHVVEAFDIILSWWLVLGAKLSWTKVVLICTDTCHLHRWIGMCFAVQSPTCAVMTLPDEFVEELDSL